MQNDLITLQEKLNLAGSVLIILGQNPTLDAVAAALALYLSLSEIGKKVSVVCDSDLTVRDSHLVGVDKIGHSVGGQNLVLTINVAGDSIDKVTSSTEDGKLSLTIIPKAGLPAIKKEDIVFGQDGVSSDLVLAIGGHAASDFGNINTPTLVNISNYDASFGTLNFVDPNSSICELVTALLQELKLNLSEDIAGNLMQGIESVTDNFQSSNMTADTFEALAILYRAGARHVVKTVGTVATIIDNTPIIEEKKVEDQKDIAAIETELQQMTNKPQADWLKPKIFSSGDVLN